MLCEFESSPDFVGFFNGLLLSNSLWFISYHLLIHLDFCAKNFIAIITPIVFPNIINRDTFIISLGHFSTFRHTACSIVEDLFRLTVVLKKSANSTDLKRIPAKELTATCSSISSISF